MSEPLLGAQRRLTAWYVGVFAVVLLLFGASILFVVGREIASQLDRSLEEAVDAIARASAIREEESARSADAVDAFEELAVPGRDLYVFTASGELVHPDTAPPWVAAAARDALRGPAVSRLHEDPGAERAWRLRARRFAVPATGGSLVGVAVADNVEVEERYPGLLLAFGVASALALALVAAGGSWLARRSTAPADAAFEQMRRFTADAAHELRTPLSVVRSRGEVALLRERDPEEYRAALRDVVREAGRLGGVVEKLLILARADAGEFGLRRERLFLDDLVEDALVTLRPVAREKSMLLDVEAPEGVPVEGDATLLQQLVLILVDNALQFGESGGHVRVRVDNLDGRARLLVRDDGPGIPSDVLPFVFERFYRGDPRRGRQAGAGLGLSIARWIAEAHGGSVTLRSDGSVGGGGTTAEVELPGTAT